MFREYYSPNFHFYLKEIDLKKCISEENMFIKEVKFDFYGITGCFKLTKMKYMYGHFKSELIFENIPENIACWATSFERTASSYKVGQKSYKVKYNLKMHCPQKNDYGYFVENYIQKTAIMKPFKWYFGNLIFNDNESIEIIVALNIFEIIRKDGTFDVPQSSMNAITKLTWKSSTSNLKMKAEELLLTCRNPYLKGALATQCIMGPVSNDGHFYLAFNPKKKIVFISGIQWPHYVKSMKYMVNITVYLNNKNIIKSKWSGWFNNNAQVAARFNVKFSGEYECPVYKSANTINGYAIGLKLWKKKNKGIPIKIDIVMKLNSLENINGCTLSDIEEFKKFNIAGLEALAKD